MRRLLLRLGKTIWGDNFVGDVYPRRQKARRRRRAVSPRFQPIRDGEELIMTGAFPHAEPAAEQDADEGIELRELNARPGDPGGQTTVNSQDSTQGVAQNSTADSAQSSTQYDVQNSTAHPAQRSPQDSESGSDTVPGHADYQTPATSTDHLTGAPIAGTSTVDPNVSASTSTPTSAPSPPRESHPQQRARMTNPNHQRSLARGWNPFRSSARRNPNHSGEDRDVEQGNSNDVVTPGQEPERSPLKTGRVAIREDEFGQPQDQASELGQYIRGFWYQSGRAFNSVRDALGLRSAEDKEAAEKAEKQRHQRLYGPGPSDPSIENLERQT